MQESEYHHLARLDREHWFYRGKRAIVRHWIARHAALTSNDVLIDAGMGTGTWLVEMAGTCRVIGLDHHVASLEIARPRVEAVGGRALQTPLEKVDLPDATASVVTLLDVLEHCDDDRAVFCEMLRLTRPGGLVVITVPALRWLWSDWDVTLGHRRRYHRPELLALIQQPGVEVLHCAYFNTLLLAPIAAARMWRRVVPSRPGAPRAEDRIPPAWLNALLRVSMVAPAKWSWPRPPLGVSLLAVVRRKAEA